MSHKSRITFAKLDHEHNFTFIMFLLGNGICDWFLVPFLMFTIVDPPRACIAARALLWKGINRGEDLKQRCKREHSRRIAIMSAGVLVLVDYLLLGIAYSICNP